MIHSSIGFSPFEKLTGRKPTLKHIKGFRRAAYIYNEHPKSKFHSSAEPGIFPSCNNSGLFTVEPLIDRKVLNPVHVAFGEDSFPGLEMEDYSLSGEQ